MSRKLASGSLAAFLLIALAAPLAVRAQDPSGASTGMEADVPAALSEAEAAVH